MPRRTSTLTPTRQAPPPVALRLPGARPAERPALTVAAVDDALRTLARLLRDHADHLGRAPLMAMAETLYAERARLERGSDVEAYMARLLEAG